MAIKVIVLMLLVSLGSCSGGKGSGALTLLTGDDSSPANNTGDTPDVPASVVETVKLQEAIKAQPEYRIDNSDIEALKAEGIIEEADLSKIQPIQ